MNVAPVVALVMAVAPARHNGNVADRLVCVRVRRDVTLSACILKYNGIPPQDNGICMTIKFHATVGSHGSIIMLARHCLVDVGGASIISDVRRNHSMSIIVKGNPRLFYNIRHYP